MQTTQIDWTRVKPELLNELALVTDLDKALAPLFALIDPDNEHDLGGHAAMYFSDTYYDANGNDIEAMEWWATTTDRARLNQIDSFFHYLKTAI